MRAERQLETRRLITEAAVQLHAELGPLATTITAIAERAGVQRLTVYRHFPDEGSLLAACTAHFFSLNPPPDPHAWATVVDPVARLRLGLAELYAYWASTEQMMTSVFRDHESDSDRAGRGAVLLTQRARDAFLRGWTVDASQQRRLKAAVGHAVHFYTWRSLVRDQGLSSRAAATLMADLAVRAAEPA